MLKLNSNATCHDVKTIARSWVEAAENDARDSRSTSTRNVLTSVQTGAVAADTLAGFIAYVMLSAPGVSWEEWKLRRAVRHVAEQFFAELGKGSSISSDGSVKPDTMTYKLFDCLSEWGEKLNSPEPRSWVEDFVNLPTIQRVTAVRAVTVIVTSQPRPAEVTVQESANIPDTFEDAPSRLFPCTDEIEDLSKVLRELDRLPGLAPVKQQIREDIALQQVNVERRNRTLPAPMTSRHMVFFGNPGTGKTTVARLVARAYKAADVLTSGHIVETDRGGLVSEFVGQSAQKTISVIDAARDGVLFIDEAYALAGTVERGPDQHAQEAVDTLVKAMEDERDRLIVILAGYPVEMQRFMDMNVGLRSRIGRTITFPDYSVEELQNIAAGMIESGGLAIDPDAVSFLADHLGRCGSLRGNARDVRNMIDAAVRAQALRIADNLKFLSNYELCTLSVDDVRKALPAEPTTAPLSRTIGFTGQVAAV